jgi:hypothetical protein
LAICTVRERELDSPPTTKPLATFADMSAMRPATSGAAGSACTMAKLPPFKGERPENT